MAGRQTILVGRYNRLAQKLFSMKGDAVVPDLAPELNLAFQLMNGVENRYLESWSRFAIAAQQAAVAAQNSAIRFRNPVGSNVVAVFEKILDSNLNAGATTDALQLAANTVDLGGAIGVNAVRLDARTTQGSSLVATKGNNAAGFGVGNQVVWNLAAGVNYDVVLFEDQEITLFPGDSMQIITITVNVQENLSFIWRERFLEDSERQ